MMITTTQITTTATTISDSCVDNNDKKRFAANNAMCNLNDILSPDVLFYLFQFTTPLDQVYILNNVCSYWRSCLSESYRQQFLIPSSSSWTSYLIRKTVLSYVFECRESFHPNAAPLNHYYDNLLFRYIIDMTASSTHDKHIDTLLGQRKIGTYQQQLQWQQEQQQKEREQPFGWTKWIWSKVTSPLKLSLGFLSHMFLNSVYHVLFKRRPTNNNNNNNSNYILQSTPNTQLSYQLLQGYRLNPNKNNNSVEPKSIKLCICGDTNVGKTALFNRFCHNRFIDRKSKSAISCVHNLYCRYSKFENKANLEIWNVSGVETYRSPLATNMSHSNCLLLCFDISNRHSFESIRDYWIPKMRSVQNCQPFSECILVGLKSDLASTNHRQVAHDEAEEFARVYINSPYVEVSSLEDISSVSVLFAYIIVLVFFRMKVSRLF